MIKGFEMKCISVILREYGKLSLGIQEDLGFGAQEYVRGGLKKEYVEDSVIVRADAECVPYPYDYMRTFQGEKGIQLAVSLKNKEFRALAIGKSNPFWAKPVFFSGKEAKDVKHVQQLLLEVDDGYIHVMALAGQATHCEMAYYATCRELSFEMSSYQEGATRMEGPIAVVTKADDPYEAVKRSYEAAVRANLMDTPLRTEKKYPAELEGLGWCTWNACYHDVTEAAIRAKLQELKEKGIRLDWMIIDDGWFGLKDLKLRSMKEDRVKFPSGLKAFIASIKREYGVKYVGVWHAFTGYWFGVEKDSEVYKEQKENLEETSAGLLIPAGEYEKAYAFYHAWHSYLAEQGVDFLKVDAQGNALEFFRGSPGAIEKVNALHDALEQSVKECFGGSMINCMGMDNLNGFHRRYSSVIRSSDDFFPDKVEGFKNHIVQNTYNAVFCSQLYYCDYDMWWTNHSQAKQSCVLRRISGGPVYISDKVGDTKAEYLKQLLNEDGSVTRYEDAAKPTLDCLFGYDKILKVYNKCGKEYVVGIFNLSEEDATVTVSSKDVGMAGDTCVVVTVKAADVQLVRFGEEGNGR